MAVAASQRGKTTSYNKSVFGSDHFMPRTSCGMTRARSGRQRAWEGANVDDLPGLKIVKVPDGLDKSKNMMGWNMSQKHETWGE